MGFTVSGEQWTIFTDEGNRKVKTERFETAAEISAMRILKDAMEPEPVSTGEPYRAPYTNSKAGAYAILEEN